MDRTTVLQEVRIMRFEDIYGRFEKGRLGRERGGVQSSLPFFLWKSRKTGQITCY